MMNPPRPSADVHALAGAYAVDAMDADERRLFEYHLDECDACRAEVRGLQATAVRLAEPTALAPPPEMRARVLEAARHTRQERPGAAPTQASRAWLPAVAAGLLLAVLALSGVLAVTAGRAMRLDDAVQVTAAADARVANLTGEASGHLVWSAERDAAVLFVDELAPAQADEVYAVWLVHGDEARLAATFDAAGDGPAAILHGDVDGADGLAVTHEPGPVTGRAQGPAVLEVTLA